MAAGPPNTVALWIGKLIGQLIGTALHTAIAAFVFMKVFAALGFYLVFVVPPDDFNQESRATYAAPGAR